MSTAAAMRGKEIMTDGGKDMDRCSEVAKLIRENDEYADLRSGPDDPCSRFVRMLRESGEYEKSGPDDRCSRLAKLVRELDGEGDL